VFSGGPIFSGGGGDDLHEAEFAAIAAGAGVESAFAPDDGFDERGVHGVTAGGGEDGNVLAVIAPLIPPPIAAAACEEQEQREGNRQPAFHRSFLAGKRTMTKGNWINKVFAESEGEGLRNPPAG